jgi:transcriptional regulator GlxA family with amidase domain
VRTSSRDFVIVLFDEVELLDVAGVMQVASAAGRHWNWRPFRLLPAALQAGPIETRSQLRLEASVALADHPEPELLFVPGGYGARRAAADRELVAWLARAAARAEVVCALGAGAALLGAAGLLAAQRIAATPEVAAWLAPELPETSFDTERRIVPSGKLLTAASSGDSTELGLTLIERVLGGSPTRAVRNSLGCPSPAQRIELAHPWPAPGKPEPVR